ncbi:hypothetical protein [Streptomyces sp. 039-1]|uniref:hypothetical protein n=1 Tax=Streptomyces sp. 039-1 TaxID=2789263 RepID=UPI0039F4E67C
MLAVPVLGLLNAFLGFLMLLAALFLLWWGNAWRKSWKVTASVAAIVLFGMVLPPAPQEKTSGTVTEADAKARNGGAPISSPPPKGAEERGREPKPTTAPKTTYRGLHLDKARKRARLEGFVIGEHDASDQGDDIWMTSNWTVCFQRFGASRDGARTIDFGAVRTGTPCPARDGGPIPWPKMPDLVGVTWKAARKTLASLDVQADRTYPDTIYGNDELPDESEYNTWWVCAHDPSRKGPITDSTTVRVWLSAPENGCPTAAESNGSALLPDHDDDGDPDYHDPFPGDRNRNGTFPSSGDAGGSDGSSGGDGWGGCRHSLWC